MITARIKNHQCGDCSSFNADKSMCMFWKTHTIPTNDKKFGRGASWSKARATDDACTQWTPIGTDETTKQYTE